MSQALPGGGERLRRRDRLTCQSQFRAVFDGGRRTTGLFLTVLACSNQLAQARLGIVASKKLGGAVSRNRAKRLIRDIFRKNKGSPDALGRDIVVIPRREMLDAARSAVEAEYRAALRSDRLKRRR